MRVVITGASGFAGGYLARACAQAGEEVIGLSRRGTVPDGCGEGRSVDLRVEAAVSDQMRAIRPEHVYHLAALSSVGHSWEQPARTVKDNLACDVAVLEALRREAPSARVVWVSSCQIYGAPSLLPVGEEAPLTPDNPYGVSKTAGDMLAGVYGEAYGLNLVRARPFNHAGPGQLPAFILSSLAEQGARARLAGAASIQIVTGNPQTRRDFTDVRDVVRAYRLLAHSGQRCAFNVSSSRSISAAEQVQVLAELIAPIKVEHVVDPARVRAHEMMDLRGANQRITAATGWHPEIPFKRTMLDTIEWWERELQTSDASGAVQD